MPTPPETPTRATTTTTTSAASRGSTTAPAAGPATAPATTAAPTFAAPTFAKVSHISFSARDAQRSAAWWKAVLGLDDLDHAEGPGWRAVLLIHPATATILEFQQHDANQGERFDPARTGFDHMGFKVDDPSELDVWQQHFERLEVAFTPTVHREYGSVLTFRDPDGIQFEMFYREGHP